VAEGVTRPRRSVAGACALLFLGLGCRATAPTIAPPPAPPAPTPAPTALPARPPAPVEAPNREDVRPPAIRVLLQTGPSPAFPEPGRRYVAVTGDGAVVIRGPMAAELGAGASAFQVGAWADAANAAAAVARLQAAGLLAQARAGADGLVRVVASGAAGESPDQLRARLAAQGFTDARPAPAADRRIVLRGEGGLELAGDQIRLVPLDPQPVRVGDKSVRGELLLRTGSSGVAVVNLVNLEQYLRGVVPSEMGPRAFPAIEALKAQAVAARTYAVAHLGEHADAGYDICDSQLCQVYGGADAETLLTDRAVAETDGEVAVYGGKPIDAMYHSTCGGHTEDAAAVFPERAAPYLRGVACRGEGAVVIGTGSPAGGWLEPTERLAQVGVVLAAALGTPPQPAALATRLGGHPAHDGVAGLVAAFGLPDLAPLRHDVAGSGSEERLLGMLATFRLPLAERPAGVPRHRWELALVVRLGQLAGAVRTVSGYLVSGPAGARLVNERGDAVQELGAAARALERRGDAWRSGPLAAPPGSPATAWCAGELCPLVEVEPRQEADAGSAWSWWSRELARDEIGRRLAFPSLEDVLVTRRGASGRVLAVTLRGGGAAREMAGYAFRRAIELPDTLFVVERRSSPQGVTLRFLGRGWGHGVGMCQNGAYGMAVAGADYRKILASYYTGVEVIRWTGAGGRQ
jgi:peptidoglycan hydrolase-like amidase